jgi:hypothetical protein
VLELSASVEEPVERQVSHSGLRRTLSVLRSQPIPMSVPDQMTAFCYLHVCSEHLPGCVDTLGKKTSVVAFVPASSECGSCERATNETATKKDSRTKELLGPTDCVLGFC